MSAEHDDQLAKLYQARKQSIVAPTPQLEQQVSPTKPKDGGWLKTLALLGSATTASFGVFALVSYLAKPPSVAPDVKAGVSQMQVVTAKQNRVTKQDSLPVVPPLPDLPAQPSLPTQPNLIKPEASESVTSEPIDTIVSTNDIADANIPRVHWSEDSAAPTLIRKVLPQYDQQSLSKKLEGKVVFSYQVNSTGEVIDIVIESTSARKPLQIAARKALKQWQYQASKNASSGTRYQVEFDFSLQQ